MKKKIKNRNNITTTPLPNNKAQLIHKKLHKRKNPARLINLNDTLNSVKKSINTKKKKIASV